MAMNAQFECSDRLKRRFAGGETRDGFYRGPDGRSLGTMLFVQRRDGLREVELGAHRDSEADGLRA